MMIHLVTKLTDKIATAMTKIAKFWIFHSYVTDCCCDCHHPSVEFAMCPPTPKLDQPLPCLFFTFNHISSVAFLEVCHCFLFSHFSLSGGILVTFNAIQHLSMLMEFVVHSHASFFHHFQVNAKSIFQSCTQRVAQLMSRWNHTAVNRDWECQVCQVTDPCCHVCSHTVCSHHWAGWSQWQAWAMQLLCIPLFWPSGVAWDWVWETWWSVKTLNECQNVWNTMTELQQMRNFSNNVFGVQKLAHFGTTSSVLSEQKSSEHFQCQKNTHER